MSRNCAIGMDIGGTNIKAGIVAVDGSMIRTDTVPTEASEGKDALLSKIIRIIQKYQQYAADQGIALYGAGVGTAGYVNRSGVIGGATKNIPDWGGTRLQELLKSQTNLRVVVDNDVNAIAMGEVWLGAGRNWDSFICVALGTGVGGCLIENKRPYRGRNGYAGGYGHQIIVIGGQQCTCGLKGCWEQYASVKALMRMTRTVAGESAEIAQMPEILFDEAKKGNKIAESIVDMYAMYVAVGLANLIHVFNPPAIVVGGAITAQGDYLFDRIRRHVQSHTLPVYLEEPVPIVPALLGEMAGIIGSARMVMETDFGNGDESFL